MRIALAWVDMSDPTDRAVAGNLARELRALGHRVCLVGPRRRPGESARSVVGGFPLYRVAGNAERALSEIAAREAVDVWHCHVFARSHRALARAALRGGWRLVLTPHLILKDYLPFLGGRAGLAELFAAASRATAVSRAARRELLELLPDWKGRCSVVYNGAPPPAAAAAALPGAIPKPYVLSVARLAPYKGQDILLMAFARLLEERPELGLVLCGRDQTGGGLKRLVAALGLADRVLLAGDRSPSEVQGLIRGCEFFALPSRRENFPLALLEAMAQGKAAVASRAGGVPEMLRGGTDGLLVPPGDVNALARALQALSRDPNLRRRLGRSAARRSRVFTWKAAARDYAALYAEALASRRKSSGIRSKK